MPRISEKVIYPELSFLVNGLCFVVQNRLGRFRNEQQYADFLETLLCEQGIPYQRETVLPPSFDGERSYRNRPDFIIDGKIVLDIKAKRIILKEDYFQMRRCLASGNKLLGLIVNFKPKYVSIKRVLNPEYRHS